MRTIIITVILPQCLCKPCWITVMLCFSDEAYTVCFHCIWLLSVDSLTAAENSSHQVNLHHCFSAHTIICSTIEDSGNLFNFFHSHIPKSVWFGVQCRLWYWHSWWLWKDLFTCCSCWRVSTENEENPVKKLKQYFRLYFLIVKNVPIPDRNLECLNLLLNTGADFNRKDSFGRFVTFSGVVGWRLCLFFQSHLNNVLSLVCFSRTPLHYAAANCNHQCLFALVGSGASVNDLDERGCTPLHYAAASDTDGKLVTISSS